ncbi:MAG: RdgB/HAM1 family non-canonical purine NTP pyrophosphatase [Planctomycetota bacterium]|jgi:XTP/dITP diphosphohydrolase|nr:RdgB/HAM1 family non-canonical purine NTP pyrophosphatase [Planctomycetota bacterium]MDP6941388.1 RdgB/HAM1 family non-canonical purine NTP pyrophosphatase [Planctomycetota bacterium]
MVQKLLLASGNSKKLAELRAMCADLPLEILSPEDLPNGLPEVDEDRDNFLENATKKAFSASDAAQAQLGDGIWALADDSGLCVDALEGAPGVYSARFAGLPESEPREVRDEANNALLLEKLANLQPDQRGASFWCVLAIAHGDELLFAVEGSVDGRILEEASGVDGFGYDPLFYHEASGCTFAHLSSKEKAVVSHRGQAIARLRKVLEQVLPS